MRTILTIDDVLFVFIRNSIPNQVHWLQIEMQLVTCDTVMQVLWVCLTIYKENCAFKIFGKLQNV